MFFKRIEYVIKLCMMFLGYLFKSEKNNIDYIRFGKDHKPSSMKIGPMVKALMSFILSKRFFLAYDMFEDEYSKKLYLKLMLFRLLGSKHVKLPLNNDHFWSEYKTIDEKYLISKGEVSIGRFSLDNYEIANDGALIKLLAHPLSVLNTFILKQYCYSRSGVVIAVESGDTVIDAGACWGDTAVYFAQRAGKSGKVYSFEFEDRNLEVFNKNLEYNPSFSNAVCIKQNAVWNKSGEKLSFNDGGPGTSLMDQSKPGTKEVGTISIDDLVVNDKLSSVDFIKMDIEGAEGHALEGAIETIKKLRPKLAISIYHSLKDFSNLPLFLKSLNEKYDLGYKFYLDHFTIYSEETVLFAVSGKRNG